MVDSSPAVDALRQLSIFDANQAGAYREHSKFVADALGPDVSTALSRFLQGWAKSGNPGLVVLTGNAGTGKTAAAQTYCSAVGGSLPEVDEVVEVAEGRTVLKDLSGLPSRNARSAAVVEMRRKAGQVLVCANEGVLRDALEDSPDPSLAATVDEALRHGAARSDGITVVNVNRQRPTSEGTWRSLIDYVTSSETWNQCEGCPLAQAGCSMRENAAALRDPSVQEQLRNLFRIGSGEAVQTFRETLSVLAWAIVGSDSCEQVKDELRDRGSISSTAAHGYFSRVLGGGLRRDAVDRSPLLKAITRTGLGFVSDLEVDGWLRDSSGAPSEVSALAGSNSGEGAPVGSLGRVKTKQGVMSFHHLGEMISTDEDLARVEDGLDALVRGDSSSPAAQQLWRQRIYFEGVESLGGAKAATARLLTYRHSTELFDLAARVARDEDTALDVIELVRGLNFLVTGFSSPNEGLIVPDPACLFSRDPGSFRPARPSLVHSQIRTQDLDLSVPDRGLVREILDVDDIDIDLNVTAAGQIISLRIRPRMYEAIREASAFRGPVGQGVAEMNDLRAFYGRIAAALPADADLRVADPNSDPPALVRVVLPHLSRGVGA